MSDATGSNVLESHDWMDSLDHQRLQAQMHFLLEIDALKSVLRATPIGNNERPENSAEHSWHLALFAVILAEHANDSVDIARVVRMLLLHDIVEIDSGDHPLHAPADPERDAKEQAAADRLFGLLPGDQRDEMRRLWDEFEAAESADARFAKAVDRLQPVLLNYQSGGGSWQAFDVSDSQVRERTGGIRNGSRVLWEMAGHVFAKARQRGWLRSGRSTSLK